MARGHRRFVNAVRFAAEAGSPRRDLPERFGPWDTAHHRFNGWCKRGVRRRVRPAVRDPDPEWRLLDGTVVRAHPHAAGMNTGGADQAPGRSRGGSGAKRHLAVDGPGDPVALHLSPGQDADVTHAETLLGDREPEAATGDEGYDSGARAATIAARGAQVVIPPTKNRVAPRAYDQARCQERTKVERCVGLLRQSRRVAARYEKAARNFPGMATLAAIAVWPR